ncbi:FtsX-like permease family protein [Endozoicomonas sp. G2_1]|uniref:ABC transporter permease n=1 Tax=Endozoicomonas sp. G2_1 TaxID=2821091 RepID=UPI001ADA8237|nr:FtsX-like permease family protein [Endozoicomonas sp. G2_1]MBO9489848.1 FtsX-like permease family protein [Endozoicomonas sp. G2_1]
MEKLTLILEYIKYKKLRSISIITAISFVILCFLLLQTISHAWELSLENRRDDRVATWNKATYALTLPREYANEINALPGVQKATFANYFEGEDIGNLYNQNMLLNIFAVDSKTYFDVFPETTLNPDELAIWKQTPNGVMVAKRVAKAFNYRVGDIVTIKGKTFPGTWKLKIVGTYESNFKTYADSLFLFSWDYLNSSLQESDPRKNEISWVMSLVENSNSLEIVQEIDNHFRNKSVLTQSMTEKNMLSMYMSGFIGILDVINIIGVFLMLIIGVLLANSMSLKVRERKFEFGVLKTMGFTKQDICSLVLGEVVLLSILASVLGYFISIFFIDFTLGPMIVKNMGNVFPIFEVPLSSAVIAASTVLILTTSFTLIPAYRASQVNITNLLKAVE